MELKNRIRVGTRMKHVKVAVALIALAFVLGGCSEDLNGKWVLNGRTYGCARSLEFVGDDTMVMLPGQSDQEVTGTIRNVDGDKYRYDVGVISLLMDLKPDGDSLLVHAEGKECHYKKSQ